MITHKVASAALDIFILAFLCTSSGAAGLINSSAQDRCAVCGMSVGKHQAFLARITFKGGTFAAFDGPKDMFRYYLNMPMYAPGKKKSDISSIQVTEYYGQEPLEAKAAFFVTGSDVMGPMGHELIPFRTMKDAKEFLKDHKGKKIVRFRDVTAETLRAQE